MGIQPKRKREAIHWYKVMMRDQPPFQAIYAGITAMAVEYGIPSRRAVEIGYSYVNKPDATLQEIERVISNEALLWYRVK